MTEDVILALIAFATLIATNLFAIWRSSLTHQAVEAIATKVDEVHAMTSAQPCKADLTSAVAVLTAAVAGPSVVVVTQPGAPAPPAPEGYVPDTRASG